MERSRGQRPEIYRGTFPYDRLLAYYRGRVSDQDEAEEIKTRISNDERWRAHWESIRHLDSERDIAQYDALQLRRMQSDHLSEFCQAVAQSNGDALIPYLEAESQQELIEGISVDEWDAHIDQCVYCRRMKRRAYALFHWGHALPLGEKILRDWLLDNYFRSELDNLTRRLQPRSKNVIEMASRRVGKMVELASGARTVLGMQDEYVARLANNLEQQQSLHSSFLRETASAYDPLWFTAAGGESQYEMIETSPVWFTSLTEAPTQLCWTPADSRGPWRVRIANARTGELFADQVDRPEVQLPVAVQDRLPLESDIKWDVRDAGGEDREDKERPIVRGVFRILSVEQVASVQARLDEALAMKPGFDQEMTAILACYEQGLYDLTLDRLADVKARYGVGPDGFLVFRATASIYLAVQRALTGKRRLGDPEGMWANKMAKDALQSAYDFL